MFDSLSVEFAQEALELLRQLEEALLALERARPGESGAPSALVQRLLHTLKGNAGLVGAFPMQRALHRLEDEALALADHPGEAARLLRAIDVLRGEAQALAAGRAVDEPSEPLQRLIAGLPVENSAPWSALPSDEIRVSQPRMDALLASAGDLVVHNAKLQHLAAQAAPDPRALRETADRLDAALHALYADLLRVRTVPVSHLFARFHRLVRDEALAQGKKARLSVAGGEVGADKAVLDALFGALVHLVRNAVAHGIETPERRVKAGKPEEGEVRLSAALSSGVVELTVEDDGAGFDVEAIARSARERGLDPNVDPATLIFTAGFSTAPLSASAGRGVGLDAVRNAVGPLGGSVEARSIPGCGARFTLRVPSTVALQRALLCAIGAETYAVPSASVLEALRIRPDQVRWLGQGSALEYRGGLVPLVDTSGLAAGDGEGAFALVLQAGGRAALRVDALLGQRDCVFQPIAPDIRGRAPVNAGTLLADGRVVLRLSPEQLVAGCAPRLSPEVTA